MKRICALLLTAAMLLCTAAFADPSADAKLGLLNLMGVNGDEWTATINSHMKEFHNQDAVTMDNAVYYDDLSALTAALENGDVQAISVNNSIAQHILAHSDGFMLFEKGGNGNGAFSMMVPADAQETLALINDALAAMSADGTLEKLQQDYIFGAAHDDAVQLPVFEGAQTIRVAITGDMPPVDHVNESGAPVGFSCALLAEIANRARVNFETVLIQNTDRADALSSGKADALFWVRNISCMVEGCEGYHLHEKAGDAVVTDCYFIDTLAALVKK